MSGFRRYIYFGFLWYGLLVGCNKDSPELVTAPTPYNLEIPPLFEEKLIAPVIPLDNPLTREGVALGERLFFEKKLSVNGRISCGSCHLPRQAFSDTRPLSLGIRQQEGFRNAMPLFNLAWNYEDRYDWDGKALGLEKQALEPVINPKEMNHQWSDVVAILQADPSYPDLFKRAFGSTKIDSLLVTKALAQFERTLISANAPFDRYLQGTASLTASELRGIDLFMDENKGDCFHCHGSKNNPLWTDNDFHNNGLDSVFTDLGLGTVTGDPADYGKFRTPSLRNLTRTAPYMHDGRFQTLEEVIDHYSEGLKPSPTIDPLMKKVEQGGVGLSPQEKSDLIAFLKSLTEVEFGRAFTTQN